MDKNTDQLTSVALQSANLICLFSSTITPFTFNNVSCTERRINIYTAFSFRFNVVRVFKRNNNSTITI